MSSSSRAPEPIQSALLDFATAPGQYAVLRRQPAVLFDAIAEVLALAVGRSDSASGDNAVTAAARFFVRTALLYPGADHHTVFGIAPETGASAATVKERYRLLMRLLHPDFAGSEGEWPPDSAARVNRAYDALAAGAPPVTPADDADRPSTARAGTPQRTVAAVRQNTVAPEPSAPRQGLRLVLIASGGLGVALLVISLAIDRPHEVQIVQRRNGGGAERHTPALSGAPLNASPSPLIISTELAKVPEEPVAPEPVAATAPSPPPPAPAVPTPASLPAPSARNEPVAVAVAPARAPEPARTSLPRAAGASGGRAPHAGAPAPVREPSVAAPGGDGARPVVAIAPAPSAERPAMEPPAAQPPASPPPAIAAAAAPVPASLPASAPRPGLTLAEAQPLLTTLLKYMESGRGDRMLNLLDPEARSKPAAVAFSRQYEELVEGGRVTLSQVQLKAEPGDGRLFVTGYVRLQVGDPVAGVPGKRMLVRAEFVNRNGTVTLTGLSGGVAH